MAVDNEQKAQGKDGTGKLVITKRLTIKSTKRRTNRQQLMARSIGVHSNAVNMFAKITTATALKENSIKIRFINLFF